MLAVVALTENVLRVHRSHAAGFQEREAELHDEDQVGGSCAAEEERREGGAGKERESKQISIDERRESDERLAPALLRTRLLVPAVDHLMLPRVGV